MNSLRSSRLGIYHSLWLSYYGNRLQCPGPPLAQLAEGSLPTESINTVRTI